jgi:hypothetical protein
MYNEYLYNETLYNRDMIPWPLCTITIDGVNVTSLSQINAFTIEDNLDGVSTASVAIFTG